MKYLPFLTGLNLILAFQTNLSAQPFSGYAEENFIAQEASAVNPNFRSYYDFATEFSKSFTPFCKPVPVIEATPIQRKGGDTETIIFAAVASGGQAYREGLRENDRIVSVDGKQVGERTFLGYIRNVLNPAIETASKTNNKIELVISREGDSSQKIALQISPTMACRISLPTFNPAKLIESNPATKSSADLNQGYSKEEIFKYALIKSSVISSFDQITTGRQLAQAQAALNFIATIAGKNNAGASGEISYTTADLLRFELLTMMTLHRLQLSVDKYASWAQSQNAEWPVSALRTANLFRFNKHYDAQAKQTIAGYADLIKNGKVSNALAEMDIKLTPAQIAFIFPNSPAEISAFANLNNIDAVPTSSVCQKLYSQWMTYQFPRAFAISSKGHCAHTTGFKSPDPDAPKDPLERALWVCEKVAKETCKMYAVDTKVVWVKTP
jgi:hypothetical protein